ncbi:MAG: homoserine kinase [Chloroflexi bacterium]|nr:homoserine kinase [Chloroflexota bacterium]MCL5274753.1 homoserine kinase [Chloroflexota bacterium]
MIKVRVPATSANLGPGFDCMGMAFNLWNTFELHSVPGEPVITVESHGEGARILPTGGDNLIAQTMRTELYRINFGMPGLLPPQLYKSQAYHIVCHNDIPCASGLGSSSTAVLAGLAFAHVLAYGSVDLDPVLQRATALEGHGDNVAPALYGGLILISYNGSDVVAEHVALPPWQAVVCVPEFNFLTIDSRAAIPRMLSRQDAVLNIGRAMLVAEALRNGDDALLARAMTDRIHEPYRIPLIPGAADAKRAALDNGALAVCLSGAGPGMLAFARHGHAAIGAAMQAAFIKAGLPARFWVLDASPAGVEITIAM